MSENVGISSRDD